MIDRPPSKDERVALQETLYTSRNPTRRWLHVTRRDWIQEAIADCAEEMERGEHPDGASPPGPTALEVGPGSGVYLPILLEHFAQVTAVDVEEAHLDDLRPRFPEVRILRDDITDSSLPDSAFDLVVCSEVVEHVPDSAAALREMYRVLRPGGRLILSTPQRYSPLELASKVAFLPGIVQLVRKIYREPVLKQGHINLMTRKTVRRQLRSAGFEIRREHLTGVYLPLVAEFGGRAGLAVARRLEGMLRRTPLRGLLWTQYCVAARPD